MKPSSTTETTLGQRMLAALADLERALETPLVSGELEPWLREVQRSLAELAPLLRSNITNEHQERFATIAEEDTDLLARVEQLRGEDAEIVKQHAALEDVAHSLIELAGMVEPREDKLEDHRQRLLDDGLSFVLRARTQEVAIDTWHEEALLRDRGVGD